MQPLFTPQNCCLIADSGALRPEHRPRRQNEFAERLRIKRPGNLHASPFANDAHEAPCAGRFGIPQVQALHPRWERPVSRCDACVSMMFQGSGDISTRIKKSHEINGLQAFGRVA